MNQLLLGNVEPNIAIGLNIVKGIIRKIRRKISPSASFTLAVGSGQRAVFSARCSLSLDPASIDVDPGTVFGEPRTVVLNRFCILVPPFSAKFHTRMLVMEHPDARVPHFFARH